MNRRDELLDVALRQFAQKGFDGASVADIVGEVGMTKAAFGYHLESKDELLLELVSPLLKRLDHVLGSYPRYPQFPDELERMLYDYVDALLENRRVVIWVDGDKAVTNHPVVGKRLRSTNQAMRRAIRGETSTPTGRVLAASALGMIWRPIRNLTDVNVKKQKEALVDAVLGVATAARAAAELAVPR